MSRGPRIVGGLLAASLATLALVAASRVPWAAAPSEDGELRLAWRFTSEPVSRCRRLSPEELARLPVHMRRETACERSLRPYRLEVVVDALSRADEVVRARGARGDRPLSVFRRVPLRPGRHRAQVRFSTLGAGGGEEGSPEQGVNPGPRRSAGPFALDTVVTVAPREVVLVTFDEERGALVVRTRPAMGAEQDR